MVSGLGGDGVELVQMRFSFQIVYISTTLVTLGWIPFHFCKFLTAIIWVNTILLPSLVLGGVVSETVPCVLLTTPLFFWQISSKFTKGSLLLPGLPR